MQDTPELHTTEGMRELTDHGPPPPGDDPQPRHQPLERIHILADLRRHTFEGAGEVGTRMAFCRLPGESPAGEGAGEMVVEVDVELAGRCHRNETYPGHLPCKT